MVKWIYELVVGIVVWIIGLFSKRATLGLALAAMILTLTATLWAGLLFLVSKVVYAVPSGELAQWVLVGLNLALPDNFFFCVSIMLSADAAVWLYQYKLRNVIAVAGK
jgi:hypothetical protein